MVATAVFARGASAVAALALVGIATLAWRRRDQPGALPFAACVYTLALTATAVAVLGRIGGPESLSWAVVASLALVFVSCWLWFVVAYTGVGGRSWTGPANLVALLPAVGILTFAYLYLAGDPIPQTPTARGPFYVVVFTVPALFVGALFLGSVIVLVRAGARYASADLRRCLLVASGAVAGGLLPLLFVSASDAGGASEAAGLATGTLAAAAGFGLALGYDDLFESVPVTETIGRDRLVTEMTDPIVVVDADDAVVDLNDAAEQALAVILDDVVGTPLADLLEISGPAADLETVEIDSGERARTYEASTTRVTYGDRAVGTGIVLRDVTDRRTRRQRLEVLNRVLRHNLRNDMTAVMGYADLLATDHDAPEEVLDRIHETAEALTDLGDKAREIEGIMAASDATDDETDLARVARYVASEARKGYPDAEIAVDLDGDVRVAASEAVCWPVVWNLVENAVEHHDREAPHVELAVRVEGDRAVVAVTDDGPGLPASERQAIVEGEEQPLSHGSGLGLWAVKWGATRVGGDLSFDDAEPRGTRITVRFPLATAGRDAEVG